MPKTHGEMPPTGYLVSIFSIRITSKSFTWVVHCVPERDLTKFSATSVVRYCPIVRCSAGAAQSHRYMILVRHSERYIEEKQTEMDTESK